MRYKVRYYFEDQGDGSPGWWMAELPDLAGGQVTQGRTLAEARYRARDLVTLMHEEKPPAQEGELPSGGDGTWEWVQPFEAGGKIAEMIRAERKAAGMTMRQAAEKIGVTFSTYQRWEDPKRCNATVGTLERVAEAFGRRLEVAFR